MATGKKKKQNLAEKKDVGNSVLKKIFSQYVLVPKKQIVAWKAYLAIAFVGGFAAALIISAYGDWMAESQAYEPFGQTTLFTYTQKESHLENEEFQLQLMLDTSGKNIVAVQAVAEYDPSMVELISVDNSISDFKYEVLKNIDSGKSEIFLVSGQPSPGINSHQAKVANISLKALKSFSGSGISLKFDSMNAITDSAAILDDGKGTNILSKTADIFEVSNNVGTETTDSGEFKVSSAISLTDNLTKIVWDNSGVVSGTQFAVERKYYKKDKDFQEIGRVSAESFSFEDRSALKKTYYYRVCKIGPDNSRTCSEPFKVKIQKKRAIMAPKVSVAMADGKVRVSWSPHYTADFRIFVQKKSKLFKKYTDITSISGNENYFEDSDVSAGDYLKYRIKIVSSGKKTVTSKVVKIRVK